MAKFILIVLILVVTVSTLSVFGDSGFSNAVTISNAGSNSTVPQLIVSENNVYVAWADDIQNKFDVFFAKSSDSGSTFNKPQSLGNSDTQSSNNIKIAEYDGKIYAVWQSFSDGASVIYFTASSNGGSTFAPPVVISETEKDSAFPQIAISGSHVYVAWIGRTEGNVTNIFFDKSDDGGTSFDKPVAITSHKGNSGLPEISATGNEVYLIWEDNSLGNFDIFLDKSSDDGKTFDTPVNVSNDLGDSGVPQMNVMGTTVYAVWMDDTSGNFDVLLSKSNDGGLTFGKPVNLSGNMQDSGYPQFTVSANNVYVVWTNTISSKNYDILFSKSSDGGKTFATPINISNNGGASGWPQVAVDGDVYVSWIDNTAGSYDVYIAKSIDDGKSFEPPLDITNTPNKSWYNKMAVSSKTVYIVWQESHDLNHDIMFAKSTTFVPEFGALVPVVLVTAIVAIIITYKRLPAPIRV